MNPNNKYTCAKCTSGQSFFDINRLLSHVSMCHSHEPRFTYACNIDSGSCCKTVRTVIALKHHVYREHRDHLLSKPIANTRLSGQKIRCPVCSAHVNSLSDLSGHYRQHCDCGQTVYCVVEGCCAEFNIHSSYSSHVSRCHKSNADVSECYKHTDTLCTETEDGSEVDTDSCFGASHEQDTYTKHVALFLLKLQEDCLLSCATIQTILDGFQEITSFLVSNIQHAVENICNEENICPAVASQLLSAASGYMLKTAFNELSSDWKRKQYYKSQCNYVEPQTLRYNVESPVLTSTFQFVSLVDSLAALLKNKKVSSQVLQQVSSKRNILSSFSDGTVFRDHPVYQQHPYALQIILYADEFDVVNPLGVHASVHKMLVFYYTIANLDRHLQSKRDAIQVVAICNSNDVKVHGMKAVADAILSDVKILEQQGIAVSSLTERVHGSIAFIAGDNLNSHLIGGFNASFNPKVLCPCRYCLTTNTELQQVIECCHLQSRTHENYQEQVNIIKKDPSQKSNFGIRYESVFNQGNFHVVDRLPPDIMHDLLEGVVPVEMALVLHELIGKKFVTLEHVNRIISTWPYGPLDKQNKPVPISTAFGDRIKQNAGRMWCLLRLLPLMIGRLVPDSDLHWCFLIELKCIVEMIFSHKISECHTAFMVLKVQDHLAAYQELFPGRNLLPKHHYLLHYPRLTSLLGPLRFACCLRFESKHAYFTRLAKVVNNFKSLCSTLAVRHQLKQAYCQTSECGFLEQDIVLSRTVVVNKEEMPTHTVTLLVNSGISVTDMLHQCRFVTISGITYHKNMYVVVSCHSDDVVFGRIKDIFVQDLVPRFLLHICRSTYSLHFGAYALEPTDKHVVLTKDRFMDYYPLTGYVTDGTKHVVLKNFVFDEEEYSEI